MSYSRQLVLNALFIAAGLVLPLFFHFVSLSGPVFLPMHLPVLLGGLLFSWRSGLVIGLSVPLLSSFLTGMPPLALLPFMTAELAVYGAAAGFLRRRCGVWPSLVGAMLLGRAGAAVSLYAFGGVLGLELSPFAYVAAAFFRGLPGIAVQLVLLPLLCRALPEDLLPAKK